MNALDAQAISSGDRSDSLDDRPVTFRQLVEEPPVGSFGQGHCRKPTINPTTSEHKATLGNHRLLQFLTIDLPMAHHRDHRVRKNLLLHGLLVSDAERLSNLG